ncbi:MAG: zinc ribbon domain-containing protein [Euryarchaeota archaeon]|nr:zinc ribbon domain-containing protein [Euryarchaeota archaeon]
MGRGIPREAEWGIGLGFIIGMVVLLVLAIQAFQGPLTVILLVVAAVFLLVGLFFLTGPQRGAAAEDAEGGASSQQQSVVIGGYGAGAEPMRVTQGGASQVLLVCPGCHERVASTFNNCPHCGTKL